MEMKKRLLTYLVLVITLIGDLLTKFLIKNKNIIIINNFLTFTYTKNTGAAWSLLAGRRFFLIIISVLFLGLIIYYSFKFKNNKRNNIAFGLIIGGLLGNLFDRIFYGYVRDFISLKFGNYYYPIFNVADIAIVISIILIIIAIIKKEDDYGKDYSKRI